MLSFIDVMTYFVMITACHCSVNMVRGVEIKMQALYNPNHDFTCFDGSKTILFSSVNDDYCDCPDSSDEPGTSACPDGKYYCSNIGFKGQYILSSRVNDGICDCCDGSDEYDSHVACFNECLKHAEEDRQKKEKYLAEANAGFDKKQDYIQQGIANKDEKEVKLGSINSQLEERRVKLENLKAVKEAAEGPEKEAKDHHQKEWNELQEKIKTEKEILERTTAFSLLDSDKNGWIEIGEVMSNQHLENDLTEVEAKDLLGGEAMLSLDGFTNLIWEAVKPKYLKDGRQVAEEIVSEGESTGDDESSESEADQENNDVPPVQPPPAEESKEAYDEELLKLEKEMRQKNVENYRTEAEDEGDDDEGDDEDDDDEESGDYRYSETESNHKHDESMPEYPEETKKLIEVADVAREEFNVVEREVRDLEQQQRELQDYLALDFGHNHEFAALKGQCQEYTDREYTYKLCPFDKVSQRSKDGGSETDLGRWGKWVQQGDYTRMKYENGQACWNGPSRSTVVTLSCGEENTVTGVSEPSRCEYEMSFKTPALCEKVEHHHSEL